MAIANQQIVAKPSADNQPAKPGDAPAVGKDAPEKTCSKAEFDRVDAARRSLQTKFTALEKAHKELTESYETVYAENEANKVALSETYTEETLANAVKVHIKEKAEVLKLKRSVEAKDKALEEIAMETANKNLNGKREQLITDYGCSIDVLEGITDPEQLEFAAWKNRTKDPGAKPIENANGNGDRTLKDPPVLPGGAGGPSLKDLPPEERVARGLQQLKNK